MDTREFTRDDWMGFAGAEGWATTDASGTLPLIGTGKLENGKEYVVVLDCTGGCLMIEDEEQTAFGGWQLILPFPSQAAASAFAKGMGEPKYAKDFFQLGFQTI